MDIIIYILKEMFFFYNEVSVYLLFGFFIAAILHVFFPEAIVRRHLGNDTLGSVVKSTLFGIPIPLCSCGVVPVAASLRNSGASKGATTSFLISTPQVGADSFMITYSLLGWVFGLFRIVASLITAMAAGITVNLLQGKNNNIQKTVFPLHVPDETMSKRIRSLFHYIEYELLGSLANALMAGIIIAGIISALIPDGFFEKHLGSNLSSMVLMLIVGIPMYVCASASTPIAASLIMKGISPGAALVFLLSGPATNAVTITTIIKTLGKKTAVVYVFSIAFFSIAMGYLLNLYTERYGFDHVIILNQHDMLPNWLKYIGTVILSAMIGWYYLKRKILKKETFMEKSAFNLDVEGMTCMHCAGNVQKAVEAIVGTSDVKVDLDGKKVFFNMDNQENLEKVKAAIVAAGYTVK